MKILRELLNAEGKNKKKEILKHANDDELEVLKMLLDPGFKTGISYAVVNKLELSDELIPGDYHVLDIFKMLNEVSSSNYKKNIAINYLNSISLEDREIHKELISKRLKLGMTKTTLNEVFPGTIRNFSDEIVLGSAFDINKLKNKHVIASVKEDGVRCIVKHDKNGVSFTTRQGKSIKGLTSLATAFGKYTPFGIYDGELVLSKNEKGSNLVSTTTTEERDYEFIIFDLPNHKGVYEERLTALKELVYDVSKLTDVIHGLTIVYDEQFDLEKLTKLRDDLVKIHNIEGLMIGLAEGNYDSKINSGSKRSKSLFKFKKAITFDLLCVDVEIATEGKNKGLIKSLVCDFNGQLINFGSGLSDDDRNINPEWYIDKIIEVECGELTTNKQGTESMRFPVFKKVRLDKDEISYH